MCVCVCVCAHECALIMCLCAGVHLTHSGASYKSASPFPGLLRTQQEQLGFSSFFKAGEERGKGGRV